LYVIPSVKGSGAAESIRRALVKAFITEEGIAGTNLPTQFVLVDDIPCNSNGKIDIYRITRDRLNGQAYNIVPDRNGDKLTDIRIEFSPHLDSMRAGTLPEGMGESSALGVFDLFNVQPSNSFMPMSLFPFSGAPFMKKKAKKNGQMPQMPQMPDKLMEISNKIQGKFYGKKEIDHFIDSEARNTF
jgi:hypothetical protein